MGRWLRWTGIVLLVLFVLAAALWGTSRLRGPSAEQRQALAMFQAQPDLPGSNAFPALWLLQWDVPEAEQASILARDAERFRSLPPPGDPARSAALAGFRSIAAERYPQLEESLAPGPASCGWSEAGCLQKVRSDREAHAGRLEQAARLVDRVEAVTGHDHYRNLLPPALDMPFPRLQLMSLAATRHALQFVDGNVDAAMANTCRALGGWRRLAANSDSLLLAMFSARGVEGHASLLAEMLAELAVDHPLPAACQGALAPLQGNEMGLCTAMRGEWELVGSALDAMEIDQRRLARLNRWLLVDREASLARHAHNLSWACSGEVTEALAGDRPVQPPDGGWGFDCVANAAGCVLMGIAHPAYADYGLRMQDARARIRLLRTLEWMRGQAGGEGTSSASGLLEGLPEALRGPARALDIDPETGRLRMQLFFDRPETHWSVPLPAGLRVTGDDPAGR